MKSLNQIKLFLQQEKLRQDGVYNYVIPDVWDVDDLGVDKIVVGDGHLMINPYDYLIARIDSIMAHTELKHMNFGQPYYAIHDEQFSLENGDWVRKSVVYSSMIRASSAFDNDRSGQLEDSNVYRLNEMGTFVKTLLILPMLKKMGVDVLYLLPITKFSKIDKKGDLGSPYAVTNFFELEPGLKDALTGSDSTVELEFKALVEACHILDIKVMIDIIPRTNARHSDYVLEHPDWFYWIDVKAKDGYRPPVVETLGPTLVPKEAYFGELFNSSDVQDHLRQFVVNPRESDPERWAAFVDGWVNRPHPSENDDLLAAIEAVFSVTVAYAFSDHINDPQPAWSDVTYFRMYFDHPVNSQPYLEMLDFEVAPYILYDVAKTSLNPGSEVNVDLWNLISNIIPYFQQNYGIDGARIDMGHALPKQLVEMIVDNARSVDPNFCFIAEELDVSNAQKQKDQGYNMIIGDGFMHLPRIEDGSFNKFVYGMSFVESPVFAAGETHDSPRLAARSGHRVKSKLITLFNYFIPNTVPFINSGQEFYEIAPMNTGLDVDLNQPYEGKLALFDSVGFNMVGDSRMDLINHMEQVVSVRNQYLDAILDSSRRYALTFEHPGVQSAAFAYENETELLVVVANTDMYHHQLHRVFIIPVPERFKSNVSVREVFASEELLDIEYPIDPYESIFIPMQAGEVKLLQITIHQT